MISGRKSERESVRTKISTTKTENGAQRRTESHSEAVKEPSVRVCEGILESLPDSVPGEWFVISRVSISLKTSDKNSSLALVEELDETVETM